MDYNIYLVDAFTNEAFKGNPAGVVPDAKRLNDEKMQMIARELNTSETAFVISTDRSTYEMRYFSPHKEIEFCGHSTLATFYVLALRGYIIAIESGVKPVYISTNNMKIQVDVHFYNYEIENIVVKMGTPVEIGVIEDRKSLLDALNLQAQDIDEKFKDIKIISLGDKYIFIPISSKEKLDNIKINRERLRALLEEWDIFGIHLFYFPEKNSNTVFTRNFSLVTYLREEPATATANGALIYLLKKEGFIEKDKITALQGEAIGRDSYLYCAIKERDGKYGVEVGGEGKVVVEGIINVK